MNVLFYELNWEYGFSREKEEQKDKEARIG